MTGQTFQTDQDQSLRPVYDSTWIHPPLYDRPNEPHGSKKPCLKNERSDALWRFGGVQPLLGGAAPAGAAAPERHAPRMKGRKVGGGALERLDARRCDHFFFVLVP